MKAKDLATKLQPVILEDIYNSIDWQMDDLNEQMEGDKYNEFHNEVFKELLKQLQEL